MRKFSILFVFFLTAISFAQSVDSTAVAIKTEEIKIFSCTVNRIPMKFVIDTLNFDVKISLIEADYLFKNNSLKKKI